MKYICNSKLKLRIRFECPYYAKDVITSEKVLFYHFGLYVGLWSQKDLKTDIKTISLVIKLYK